MAWFQKLKMLGISMFVMLAMVACGTTGDPGNGNGNGNGNGDGSGVTQIGFVMMDESQQARTTSSQGVSAEITGAGAFWEVDQELPADFVDAPFSGSLDTCEVFTLGEAPTMPDFPIEDFEFSFLDAGAALTVTGSGGFSATLDRETMTFEGETFIVYGADYSATGVLPADLDVTVPGNEFPAFANEAFPSNPSFSLTSPTGSAAGNIGVDTSFTWVESGEANSFVTIDVMSSDFSTFVSCIAADDGEFSFPADTQAELGAGFDGQLDFAGRQVFRIVRDGNAILVLSSSSTQNFDFAFKFPVF